MWTTESMWMFASIRPYITGRFLKVEAELVAIELLCSKQCSAICGDYSKRYCLMLQKNSKAGDPFAKDNSQLYDLSS